LRGAGDDTTGGFFSPARPLAFAKLVGLSTPSTLSLSLKLATQEVKPPRLLPDAKAQA